MMKNIEFYSALLNLQKDLKTWLKLYKNNKEFKSKKNDAIAVNFRKLFKLINEIPSPISVEDFHKQKTIDPSLNIEDIDIDADHIPILLRDHDGNLYFHQLGLGRIDFVDDAKSIGDGKMTVIREHYCDLILFTVKGNPIFAKRRMGYEELTVKEGKDGKPDYNISDPEDYIEKKIITKTELVDGVLQEKNYKQIETLKTYTDLYKEEENINKQENCIAHTITSSEEDLWVNPVVRSEKIGIDIPNVKRMIDDGNFKLISKKEDEAQAGDLIVFTATEELIKRHNKFNEFETQPGDYIHAAIYNGNKSYSSKNGELPLNDEDSLKNLIQRYGTNYEFYRAPKDLNPKTNGTVLGKMTEIKLPGYDKILFKGREILTLEDVKNLSEKEIIEKASKEIKDLLDFDKDLPQFIEKLKSSFANAKIDNQKDSYSDEESIKILEGIQKALNAAIQD